MIRLALILFPGSNCERETALAVRRSGMEPIEFLWNEDKAKLASMDGFILIGGFSYEDRSRAGIIAALDPLMAVIKQESLKGKPVLGICNGAQILVEAGLILEQVQQSTLALTDNKRLSGQTIIGLGFYNAWVKLCLAKHCRPNAFTQGTSVTEIMRVPVAHAEGRFVMSEALLADLYKKGLVVFQYCDENGKIDPDFPVNPNGSIDNIAAIANAAGNVMAIMPHPERTSEGDSIFSSMRQHIQTLKENAKVLSNYKEEARLTPKEEARHPEHSEGAPDFERYFSFNPYHCLVALIITDNQAMSVQHALRQLGFPVVVNRYVHWEIDANSLEAFNALKNSDLLFCPRREREIATTELPKDNAVFYLVRPKEDIVGKKTWQTLNMHTPLAGLEIKAIQHAVLWQFQSLSGNIHELIDAILQTNIIGNPYAHDCYEYQLSE